MQIDWVFFFLTIDSYVRRQKFHNKVFLKISGVLYLVLRYFMQINRGKKMNICFLSQFFFFFQIQFHFRRGVENKWTVSYLLCLPAIFLPSERISIFTCGGGDATDKAFKFCSRWGHA